MRKLALLAALAVIHCNGEPDCADCFNPNTPSCTFGPTEVALSTQPGPPPGGFAYDGLATVTSVDPLTLALDVRSISIANVTTTLAVDDVVDVAMLGFCNLWCDLNILIGDTNGLVLAAWDTTSMTSVQVPGWVLTYTDENCVLPTGDPVVPAIAAITLAAELDATEVQVAAGTEATLSGFTVRNGQSTVNTHPVGTDIPDRWFRGAIVRQ
ncbi:MAG TPA: hypothetical protein VLC93_18755 [Myxococcota bacterium]|nr:hypothetical protein [Myxococcota bacterium]